MWRFSIGSRQGVAVTVLTLLWTSLAAALPKLDLSSNEIQAQANTIEPIAPTPLGDGHIGLIQSGDFVRIRFPLPAKVDAFAVRFGNVVGFSGKGTPYQLEVRRESATGPVVYKGPIVAVGDDWNRSNQQLVNLTAAVQPGDLKQGFIDLWITGLVKGDGWTLYRYGGRKNLVAYGAVIDPAELARRRLTDSLPDRGIALIPTPKSIEFKDGGLRPDASTVIALPPQADADDHFAAQDLQEQLRTETGVAPKIVTESSAPAEDAVLLARFPRDKGWVAGAAPQGEQSYTLTVTPRRAVVIGADAAGLFYGAQTAAQLVPIAGKVMRAATVDDRPAFPIRGFQYDIARGQTVNIDYCKRIIRELARLKVNAIMFYMEDDFKFDAFPFLGRKDTFTPAKARELSAYAKQRHMQLIPQFESLGHASAVLNHPEMAPMREAGGSWVFCTSAPQTWEFLDKVYGELTASFTNTDYIHVGGDEFESGFDKCDRCRAFAAKNGIGGLYAEHFRKIDALVHKYGKRALFWTSHVGPTPELSHMTVQYADKMPHDLIPTEWIYHGPAAYPEIQQLQHAGYADVWCCPAVVGYSVLYPDYVTTYRGIRGFFQAGAAAGCPGAMTTTWEFMHGSLFENAWAGLVDTAEQAWNPGATSQKSFDMRFAERWFGLDPATARREVVTPNLVEGPPVQPDTPPIMRNTHLLMELFWTAPDDVMRQYLLRTPELVPAAPGLIASSERCRKTAADLRQLHPRNEITLRFMEHGFAMLEHCGKKIVAFATAAKEYTAACDATSPEERAAHLKTAAAAIRPLADDMDHFADTFAYAAAHCGGSIVEEPSCRKLANQYREFAKRLETLAQQTAQEPTTPLPPGSTVGLPSGRMIKLGGWTPKTASETPFELHFPVPTVETRVLVVECDYTRGAHGATLLGVRLEKNGTVLASDEHRGWTGAGTRDNVYQFTVPAGADLKDAELVVRMQSSGGTDSTGEIWLLVSK